MAKSVKKPPRDRMSLFYWLVKPLTALLVYPVFCLRVVNGKHNIPKTGAAIVAGNHISLADPVFLRFAQRRQIRFMAKAELFDKPFMRWLCSSYGAFPVIRGTADSAALHTSLDILKQGRILGIFPEGTRSTDGTIGRGKSGVAMLAYESQAPVYPFAVYAPKKPLSLFSRYTIAFGKPITAAELGILNGTAREYREGTRKLMKIITDLQQECKEARGQ